MKIFTAIKKAISNFVSDILNEAFGKDDGRDLATKIDDAATTANIISQGVVELNKMVAFIHSLEKDKSKALEFLHFITTCVILMIVMFKD